MVDTTDPIPLPSETGLSGSVVVSSTAVVTAGLTIDSGAPASSLPTNAVFTVVESAIPSATQSANAASAVSSKSISLSAVIGSCVGAFVLVIVLIIFGIWFYRRYSDSLKKHAMARHRNLQCDKQRRQWNKLEDGEEGITQTKEVDQVAPMEKLTMFERAASVRTAYTQKSVDDAPLTYPQSFAPFDTNLVRTLSADRSIVPQSQLSQNANSIKAQSSSNPYPSSNSIAGPLSSNMSMAIPTPQATVTELHKWESAEVVHYTEGQSGEVLEPSPQDKDVRRSMHNPFFGSQEYSRPRSDSPPNEKSPNTKGKERIHNSVDSSMISEDPFEAFTPLSKPAFVHQATNSSVSTQSKERALQTLMGALELSEDEVRERLRVASMQPSVISQLSQCSNEEEFLKKIVLPTRDGTLSKP